MPLERAVSLECAESIIDHCFEARQLVCTIARHGALLSSTTATLEGELPDAGDAVGCGKGYADEARVGAKFEAYEHSFGPAALKDTTRLADFEQMSRHSEFCDLLPMRLLAKSGGTQMGVIAFEATEDLPCLNFPAFLIDYTYVSQPLPGDDVCYAEARRYACGTGLATGVGVLEASIHAAGEVVERHGVGRFIARHYFRQVSDPVLEIARASVPRALGQLLDEAESEIGDGIVIYDASSEVDCPVVIARSRNRSIAGIHVIGAGASIHGEHSATRAIKELVQQYKVVEGEPHVQEKWARSSQRLMRFPRLHRCLRLQPQTQAARQVDFSTIEGVTSALPLQEHLDLLRARCAAVGRPIRTRELICEPSGVVLACAVMPRMERFSIVSLGGAVVPCYY